MVGGIIWFVRIAHHFIENAAAIAVGVTVAGAVALIVFAFSRMGGKAAKTTARLDALRSEPNVALSHAANCTTDRVVARSFVPTQIANARWIDPGQSIRVQDTVISSGLFYLGEAVKLPDGRTTTQYVFNPRLAISAGQPDVLGSSMPYWPSYTAITPNARRAFLEWMAGGRKDPTYGISHIFLFFYGVEHKQFIGGDPTIARVLIPEIERLLSIYGQSKSFRQYAANFLICAKLAAGILLEPPRLSPGLHGFELSPAVRVYLGEKLAVSNVLSASDTLLWVLALPNTHLRTAAIRCFDQFTALWSLRFTEKFPSGYQVNVPAKRLKFTYRAASAAFAIDVPGSYSRFPDIAAVSQSLDVLTSLVQACTDELHDFSRFVGRRPDKKFSFQAALLLPEILQRDTSTVAIQDIKQRITAILGTQSTAATKMRDILKAAAFEFSEIGKLPQFTCDQLGKVLDRIDIAIEPDRRYGGGVPELDDQVIIFKADQGGPIDARGHSYQMMKVQVEVSALAATASGEPTVDELQKIIANIKAREDLSEIERLRLIAYALTIFKNPRKQDRIMRRLLERPETEREAIAKGAVSVVGTESQVGPNAVRFLERLHKALGLPRENVYADLHRAAAARDEPVIVLAENRVPGIPIPRPEEIRIDPSRLAAVQKQTQEVSRILRQIFVDDAGDSKIAGESSSAGDASPFEGLDKDHAELVEYMEMKGEIPHQEFEGRAKALQLLPAGAIEKINEWSFDHFNAPLLEEGDHIVLSANLRERLVELRQSSA
jgi:hypothetical protein